MEIETAKRKKVERELHDLQETAKKDKVTYKSKFKQLVKKVAWLAGDKKAHIRRCLRITVNSISYELERK